MRDRIDLFLVSILVLFLELACIRWFPAHVLFLTFFTNTVLLAAFLGMSVGCLAAGRPKNYLVWTPLLLVLAFSAAHFVEWQRVRSGSVVDVGNQVSAQLVFFGVESQQGDPSKFVVPIEMVSGLLFVMIALVMTGPGQQLGRCLARIPNRVEAYTVNIAGSIAGILVFTAAARWQIGPAWWFAFAMLLTTYFVLPERRLRMAFAIVPVVVVLSWINTPFTPAPPNLQETWSPYYRINYYPAQRAISVNLIGQQSMVSRQTFSPAYSLPHLLNRDSGRPPFSEVLVIGAGSGNDVSRALAWSADRVDAVEIDPVIYGLGRRDHPDAPYADPRVLIHLDDGRNFLRSTDKQYDLIVYALVDSLVLHSSYSNIRLESYLFTTQAFADIKKRLKPGGVFVMYNYFRQGWIVSRLEKMLDETFGAGNPVVFNLPARPTVHADDVLFGEFTVFMAGATGPIKEAFARTPDYFVANGPPTDRLTPNGFEVPDAATRATLTVGNSAGNDRWVRFRTTSVVPPRDAQPLATDSWPFLYLQRPMIPALTLRGMVIMGIVGLAFVMPFVRSRPAAHAAIAGRVSGFGFLASMFFLGAGFMLIETKAVVHMALLFGSTWFVNSIVFCAVLVMILVGNLFVLAVRPHSLTPFYIGLAAALVANAAIPMDAFLGLSRGLQIAGSCLIAFAPIFFAAVVFAVSFSHAADADRAFGANIAGAMFGGLCENSSMLLGFQYVVLVAAVFYLLSAAGAWAASRAAEPFRLA